MLPLVHPIMIRSCQISKTFLEERPAGCRFQITLELRGTHSITESDVSLQLPRSPFRSVENSARVMIFHSPTQVVR